MWPTTQRIGPAIRSEVRRMIFAPAAPLLRGHRARLTTRFRRAGACIMAEEHIDAHCSKDQKHNRGGADPHHTHFVFFSVWVVRHRFLLFREGPSALAPDRKSVV